MSEGEVGREGVAIDTLADMEALLDDIDLEKISVSLTINPTAWILLAMYVALAEKRGYDLNKISGTVQADILKEYMAQKEYIYPIAPSVRICRDIITYSREAPAALQPDQHLRLSHLRGRLVAAAGSGLHAGQPDRLRRGGAEDRHAGRRVRAAARVLLRVAGATSSRRSPSSARCAAATPRS